MVLDWEASHARFYALEVSTDGRHWKVVYRPDGSKGGSERVRFAATEAHWMRLRGIRRATAFGDSLRERRCSADEGQRLRASRPRVPGAGRITPRSEPFTRPATAPTAGE